MTYLFSSWLCRLESARDSSSQPETGVGAAPAAASTPPARCSRRACSHPRRAAVGQRVATFKLLVGEDQGLL
eukprot:11772166-Heterocapsa_arctica.AAC.1